MADLGNILACCALVIAIIVQIGCYVQQCHRNKKLVDEMKRYDPLKEAHLSVSKEEMDRFHRDMPLSDTMTLPLTDDQVKREVDNIKGLKYDPETAHGFEDDMYWAVMVAIADGKCDDPQACAKAALKSKDIGFPRYYA